MSLARSRGISERGETISGARLITWRYLWYHATLLCSLLISASISIIIARALGPEIFGGYLFAQWLATIMMPIIGTGMSTLAARQVAEVHFERPEATLHPHAVLVRRRGGIGDYAHPRVVRADAR